MHVKILLSHPHLQPPPHPTPPHFDNEVPVDFWKLLAFYISLGTITSLPWAIPFGEGEIKTMKSLANEVLGWYDNMLNVVPKWYKGVLNTKDW